MIVYGALDSGEVNSLMWDGMTSCNADGGNDGGVVVVSEVSE